MTPAEGTHKATFPDQPSFARRTRPIAGAARAWHLLLMGEAIGTFEQVVALEPQHDTLLRALRALALDLHPDLVEVARPGDRAVSWGWGPKKMSEAYACALPYKDHVNLAFYRGADLADPTAKLRGTGKAMRHMPLAQLEQLNDPAVRELLVAARVERQQALRGPA